MEHPIIVHIRRESFTPLGWFETQQHDLLPNDAKFVILIGNAGPDMFHRFAREHAEHSSSMDQWTKSTVDHLARDLDAEAVYPFDKPPLPFLTWASRAGAGHTSPLGLNIHPTYGLWHAYRAALLFQVAFDLPKQATGHHPCETCEHKPCLHSCPVSAFEAQKYNVEACVEHLQTSLGQECMKGGCKARLACPIGKSYTYVQQQREFHMDAFLRARTANQT